MKPSNKIFLVGKTRVFAEVFLIVAVVFVTLQINMVNVFAYTESISTSGSVTIDVSAVGDKAGLGVDNLVVTSTCPAGYTISISGPSDSTLYRSGDNTSSDAITASSGTLANPVSILGNNLGTWGYSVTSGTTINSNFVGLTNTPTVITTKATASASGGDTISVYYGASVTSDQASGNYTLAETSQGANDNVIVYKLLPSANCYNYYVEFNANGGSGTMTNQEIVPGVATALTTNGFTAPSGKVFGGWNTAADGSGTSYTDEEVVTDLTTPGDTITLYAQWKSKLYDAVAALATKGTQTANDLQATITTSNSGVYTYNSSIFGAATDASNDYTIYYYRGILDNTTGTYGSDGDGAAYPNYVKLDNTCWRIVRTTGSGGVKMIYNGTWTGSTCANATTNAQISSPVATSTFDGTANTQTEARQAVRVGYTHNSSYANTTSTSNVAVGTAYGSNNNPSLNNTDSAIKGYVETWFNNTLSGYSGILESNAGFCNDRYSYTTETGTTASTNIRPYYTGTNTGANYVGWYASQHRNATTSQTPSLGCSSSRNIVDVYSTDTSAGGNGQLDAPVGLLTADEASFAGSGSNTAANGSIYNANSYLRTGSNFWTMSPYARTGTYAYSFYLNTNGYLQNGRVDTAYGIRPVISLVYGTMINGGSGTATNPWTIKINEYTVHFDANGGSGTMSDQIIVSGAATALNSNTFTPPTKKVFSNWNTRPDGSGTSYTNGHVVTDLAAADGTITLYAQWGNASELYNLVAVMSKGTQSASDLRATITASNSGVYEYNSSAFGVASDASNDHTIYYYRGILDNTTGSQGSNGDAGAYPNYVKLGNTCWRIFRTTGSGGVKMIYNGTWTGTTCANATTDAQVAAIVFGSQAGSAQNTWYNNIQRAGYTYNASVDDSTTSTSVDTVLGSNSNYSTTNTTSSSIKTYIENTWFTSTNGVSAYESILEPSAGYCNDRSVFSNEAGTTPITNVVPYATTVAYFGAYTRHKVTNGELTLTCPRGTVDIYTTSSATDGNKQLAKPVALITADEAALSGNGYGNNTASSTNTNSFLNSGSLFWTMSPRYRRGSDGSLREYSVGSTNGAITGSTPSDTDGLRPVISLEAGTTVSGGTGVATDPWTVGAP